MVNLKRGGFDLLKNFIRAVFTDTETTEQPEQEVNTSDPKEATMVYWEEDKKALEKNNQPFIDLFEKGVALEKIPDVAEKIVKESQYKFRKLVLGYLSDIPTTKAPYIASSKSPYSTTSISTEYASSGSPDLTTSKSTEYASSKSPYFTTSKSTEYLTSDSPSFNGVTEPPKTGTGISSSGRDAGMVAGIVVAVISGILIFAGVIAVVLYRHYVHRNVTSMNFDNPVYRKTTEDQFAIEKNGYAPGSKLYPSTVGEEAQEPLNSPGTNEFV